IESNDIDLVITGTHGRKGCPILLHTHATNQVAQHLIEKGVASTIKTQSESNDH
ncbi:MAG: hypothetical protein JRF30_05500, partial [Deltaproteobacteria bacterium]|nr:hypothetical protein [Deltaproteobacteria bacterium]MBW2330378.1 hypothetical protein [Deltaproteobacteria bacterium]